LAVPRGPAILSSHGHQIARDHLRRIRAAAEQATEARKTADRLAVAAWNKQRMLGLQGPGQPSPALGDALNAGCRYLEEKCLGCNTHSTVALDIVRRPKTTPIHELERYMRCKDCSQVRGYATSAAILWRCARQDQHERSALDMVAGGAMMKVNLCPAAFDFSQQTASN
jgi:hypothetical protein